MNVNTGPFIEVSQDKDTCCRGVELRYTSAELQAHCKKRAEFYAKFSQHNHECERNEKKFSELAAHICPVDYILTPTDLAYLELPGF